KPRVRAGFGLERLESARRFAALAEAAVLAPAPATQMRCRESPQTPVASLEYAVSPYPPLGSASVCLPLSWPRGKVVGQRLPDHISCRLDRTYVGTGGSRRPTDDVRSWHHSDLAEMSAPRPTWGGKRTSGKDCTCLYDYGPTRAR